MFKDRDMKLNTARGSRKQRRRVAHRGGLTAPRLHRGSLAQRLLEKEWMSKKAN